MVPHDLRFDTLFEEDERERERWLAQPLALGHPFVNLVQVTLQDLRGEGRDEGFSEWSVVWRTRFDQAGGISISIAKRVQLASMDIPKCATNACSIHVCRLPDEKTVQVGIGPFLRFPPMVEFSLINVFRHGVGGRLFVDDPQKERAPVYSGLVFHQVRG